MAKRESIREQLFRMEQNQHKILALLEPGNAITAFNMAEWVTQEKVMDILGFSLRSLYRFRKREDVMWVKIGGRSYYSLRRLLELRDQFLK